MLERRPKVVLFDFGGTLIENGPSDTRKALDALRLAAKNPDAATLDQLHELWKRVIRKIDESKQGVPAGNVSNEIALTPMLRNIIDSAGLEYDIDLTQCGIIFDTAHFPTRRPTKNIDKLMEKLKAEGIRTAVISNTTMNSEEMGAAVKAHVPENTFEWIMTSAEYVFMKPDTDMFEISARRMGVSPEDCLYCGDDFTNDVVGPSRIDMMGLFYDVTAEKPLEKKEQNSKPYLVINDWMELVNLL